MIRPRVWDQTFSDPQEYWDAKQRAMDAQLPNNDEGKAPVHTLNAPIPMESWLSYGRKVTA